MPLSDQVRAKLRAMGIEPDDMLQRMRSYVGTEGQAFATPQEYAGAIQAKQAAGEPLQDPHTAAQFQQMAPQMFGGEPPKPYTEFPFNVGQVPEQLASVTPQAHAMLDAMAQYQRETPFRVPYAPGTPTIAQREAERGARQWEQTFEEGVRQFELGHELALRQQEHREWLDRQNLALSRAAARGAAAGLPTSGPATPWGAIDAAIGTGFTADELMEYIMYPMNRQKYGQYGLTEDEMLDYGLGKFQEVWGGIGEKSRARTHYSDLFPFEGIAPEDMFEQAREAEARAARAEELMREHAGGFTEADYQRFAQETGRTVEEIRFLDSQGWLDKIMQDHYRDQLKWTAPEDILQKSPRELYEAGYTAEQVEEILRVRGMTPGR